MKNIYTLVATLLFSQIFFATIIPDANFEQALINLGYDNGTPDGFIPAANINSITNLNVSNNNISDLTGIEDFNALTILYCYNNQLASLDVSNNPALIILACHNNQLTSLDLSQNTLLAGLDCYGNQLTELDLSLNVSLDSVNCSNQWSNGAISNSFTCLNVKNGNNTNMGLFANGNPFLTCIEVDDPVWSTTNWTVQDYNIDATASFSTNCNNPCSSTSAGFVENTVVLNIYPNPVTHFFVIETQHTVQLKIYNVIGKVVFEKDINTKYIVNTSKLLNGIYFLKATNDQGEVFTKKIIKK